MLQRRIISILACTLALGCTNLADEETKAPPLATIAGTLTLGDGATVPDETIRMAILWETEESANISDQLPEGGDCGPSRKFLELSMQSVELDPTFPNAFTLDLTEPPPAETLLSVEEGGDPIQAMGTIVVYADGDDDGVLDVRTAGSPSPDRVLATSAPELWRTYDDAETRQIEVYYSTEPVTHASPGLTLEWPQGFSMQTYNLLDLGTAIVSIDTPIELNVTGAPHLQDLLCESICNDYSEPYECPASPADLPEPPSGAIEFEAGNTHQPAYGWSEGGDDRYTTEYRLCGDGFSWTRTTCEGCTCRTDSCFYEQADVAEADWPCAQ